MKSIDESPLLPDRMLMIGSSPMSLFIALIASRMGCRVTLVARNDRLGGAWATDDIDGQIIDRACHLLEPLTPGPGWMFDQLGQVAKTFAEPPLAVTPWGSILPIQSRLYRLLNLAMALPGSGRHILKAAGRGSRIELRRVISEARHDLGRLSRRAMQEVVAGPSPVFSFSPQPFVRLCDLVADEVDEIRLETTVGCIDAHPDRPEITTVLDGVTRRFEQVVVPSGADVQVRIDGRPIGQRRFQFENHHILFQAVAGEIPFEYVAFMSDRLTRRVVDTGPSDPDYQPIRRFLAQVRSPAVEPDQVVQRLARHRLAKPNSLLTLDRTYSYTSTRTVFTEKLPRAIWAPDTYGDLSDNITRLLVGDHRERIELDLPFPARP